MVSMTQIEDLGILASKFVKDQRISCAETIYQTDRVIENALEFIEEICNIIGYYESPEDYD